MDNTDFSFQDNEINLKNLNLSDVDQFIVNAVTVDSYDNVECCGKPIVDEETVEVECCDNVECCGKPIVDEENLECCEEPIVDEENLECCDNVECCEEPIVDEENLVCCEEASRQYQDNLSFDYIQNINETNPDKYNYVIIVNTKDVNQAFLTKDVFALDYTNNKSKWENVITFLMNCKIWKKYRYVWIPDSQIMINQKQVNTFLKTIGDHNVTIGQPSLMNKKHTPYQMLHNKQKHQLRKTTFVESMMPCFQKEFLENYLVTFLSENSSFLKSGCGIDLWWSSIHSQELFVIDTVRILHECPIASNELCVIEKQHFIKKYKLTFLNV